MQFLSGVDSRPNCDRLPAADRAAEAADSSENWVGRAAAALLLNRRSDVLVITEQIHRVVFVL